MSSDLPRRWARVQPQMSADTPGYPTVGCRIVARHPDDILYPEPLPGYVWLDAPGRPGHPLHVESKALEFRDDEPQAD